jgi:AcrR family transcriptional regulator
MATELNLRTRERILDGAMAAIARHGLSKLGMSDVSVSAGVSRGTLYRYFPSRDDLLRSLAAFESQRFRERVSSALRGPADGTSRLETVLQLVTRYVREHPAIQRVIETEPAFVLDYLRAEFASLRAITGTFLAPLLAQTAPVREGLATTDQLVDWMTRVMISAVLLPDPDPDRMAHGLTAVYRLLAGAAARPARGRARRPRKDRP